MLHPVLPIADEIGVQQLTLLGRYAVRERTSITHRNLLIPSFCTCHLLAFEGVEAGQRDIERRQGHRNR